MKLISKPMRTNKLNFKILKFKTTTKKLLDMPTLTSQNVTKFTKSNPK
jgi:hypothetical protein